MRIVLSAEFVCMYAKSDSDKTLEDPAGSGSDSRSAPNEEINIVAPMSFWIAILVIGLLLRFAIGPAAHSVGLNSKDFTLVANFILYQPGAIILPLIVAVWVGSKVGRAHKNSNTIGKVGLVNAVYAAVIYSVAIFIIYLVFYYADASALPTTFTLGGFALNVLAIPDAIVLVVTPLLAMLSSARHSKK